MNIKQLYYEVWADAIETAKNNTESFKTHRDKMFTLLIGFSIAQGYNMIVIVMFIYNFIDFKIFLDIDIFPGSYLDNALSGIITMILPFAIINYYLIFYKRNYLKYMKNRKINTKGKAFFLYFICSTGLYLLIVITGKWILPFLGF